MSRAKPVLQGLVSLLAGTVFGVGLAVAQMIDPNKVLGFLDVAGAWDASLLLVLGGAVTLTAILFRLVLRRATPVLDDHFHLPTTSVIDARLLTGAALFGVGWGVAGYCPGPAVASLGFANPEAMWLLPAILLGAGLQRWLDQRHRDQHTATKPPTSSDELVMKN
ncbi:YeeE/YedE family protein [Rhodoferax sp. U11-2br]|uniref:YeeE/YedE family protein n=1 Tax=Rhodoferax sp. U11-2br TaxID=2838878 RepID=UPI001BE640BC|nr:YeeE/YedE family protein [Rhodoferax sp. U11-2br]MBT3065611.1 YeeE/YedE family protein [Rhodoferax sp. U11-2br]